MPGTHTAQSGQQNPLGLRCAFHAEVAPREQRLRGHALVGVGVLWITVCWTQNMTAWDSHLLSDQWAGDECTSAWRDMRASLYPDP